MILCRFFVPLKQVFCINISLLAIFLLDLHNAEIRCSLIFWEYSKRSLGAFKPKATPVYAKLKR